MKRLAVLVVMMTMLISTLVYAAKLQETGVTTTSEGTFSSFDELEIEGAFDVTIEYGDAYSYKMTADDVYKGIVMFEMDEQTLKISLKRGVTVKGKNNPKIVLYIPSTVVFEELEVEVSGASSLRTAGLKAKTIVVEVSGASKVDMSRVDLEELDVDLSGASTGVIDGYATEACIELSGVSSFKAHDLDMKECEVKTSGVSSVRVGKVSHEFECNTSGVSSVKYSGEPKKVVINTSGVSNVNVE